MIRAIIWQDPQKHIFKFSINGHANYDEAGSDIVCAAVSALVISTINGLTEIVGTPVDCLIEEDMTLCEIPLECSPSQQQYNQILLQTMSLGLSEIAKEYADYLSIKKITYPLPGGEDNA